MKSRLSIKVKITQIIAIKLYDHSTKERRELKSLITESPEGDDTRGWGPPFIDRGGDRTAAYFYAANRGKDSVVADFRTDEGKETVLSQVRDTDILIENFKVGGLAKYGLDYDRLSALNPRLIYCSITGFGQSGPYAARPGYDFLIQGMSGLMSITGEPRHGGARTHPLLAFPGTDFAAGKCRI